MAFLKLKWVPMGDSFIYVTNEDVLVLVIHIKGRSYFDVEFTDALTG